MCRNQAKPVQSTLAEGTRILGEAGIDNARREAEWLLMHVTGRTRLDLVMHPDAEVPGKEVGHLYDLIDRRANREPMQYILGEAAFFGYTFKVTPDVLIPRPETEELVEKIIALPPDDLAGGVIDLGTGSGCIPVTIALEKPGIPCTGVDLSAGALAVARANAERLGADVSWVEADMEDQELDLRIGGKASVLVSNPPYIPDGESSTLEPEVRDHEPAMALFSGADPLRFYRVIARQAPRLLRSGGHILVEIHADGGASVCRLFEEAGFENVVLQQDMAGRDRIVRARLS